MKVPRKTAVVVCDVGASAAAARMTQQGQVCAARKTHGLVEHGELPELDEMIAAAARAQLRPRAILHPRRDVGHAPVGVHDAVLTAGSKRGAHAKACFFCELA